MPSLPEATPLVQAVGWALVHSAWQLLVIAALLWGTLILLRGASSLTRYWVSVAALLAGAVLPVLTAFGVLARLAQSGSGGAGLASALPWVGWLPAEAAESTGASALATGGVLSERIATLLPTLTVLWLVVVIALSTRLVLGWSSVQRLRKQRTRRLPTHLTRRFYRVARGLGVRGVRFLESRAVEVPMVVGWLSPVVLIPAAAVLRLAPHELESVVAHELAHVRRRDYLVNLIQTVVETVLFFHPAVWWISKRIRAERECCCDDTAVSTCGDPLAYARALTELESLRAGLPRLALGATGGELLERVRRLVGSERGRSTGPRRDLGGLVVLLSTTVLLLGTGLSVGASGTEEQAPAPFPDQAPRVFKTIMLIGQVSEDQVGEGEVPGPTHASLQLRFDSVDLPEGGQWPTDGLSRFRFEREFELGTADGYEVIDHLPEGFDEAWGELLEGLDEPGLGDVEGISARMVVDLDDEHTSHLQAGQWAAADLPHGYAMHLSADLPDELRAGVERLLDDQHSPEGASGYRAVFVVRTPEPDPSL